MDMKKNSSLRPWPRTGAGDRIICMRAKIMLEFRRDMARVAGPGVTREILYRIGLNVGRTVYENEKQAITSDDQFWLLGNELMTTRGWGRIVSHQKSSHNDKLRITVLVEDSAFSESVTAAEPLCDLFRGALGGWAASFYGLKVLKVDETGCTATGAPHCEFAIHLGPKAQMNFH